MCLVERRSRTSEQDSIFWSHVSGPSVSVDLSPSCSLVRQKLAPRYRHHDIVVLGIRRPLLNSCGKAMDWYLKAYEIGDGDALNNIGVMYRDGLGVAAFALERQRKLS